MSDAKQEIDAIGQVLTVLNSLDNDGIGRVLDYACDWYRSKCHRELMEKINAVGWATSPTDGGTDTAPGAEDRATKGGGAQAVAAPRDRP